ncbi:hypothetical protein AB7M63_006782 [Bradyrhizobium japonicum]
MSNDATGVAATPDNQAAIDFLKLVYPQGPWVLTAIRTDRKAIETRTFRPTDEDVLLAWLKRHNGARNIYWQVNPPVNDTNKKSERENIKALAYLHVDIDPRVGEDLAEERKRIEELLTTKLPDGVPVPTYFLFSGGGYQAFWKLEAPFLINGEEVAYEEAKRWNQQLEYLFGGDNCHNVDRIMRVPGTINIPDARKTEKGRQRAGAYFIGGSGGAYPLGMFEQMSQQSAPTVRAAGRVQVSTANIKRMEDINELDTWSVPDRVKVLCVQGNDPENATKYPSRSEALYDAVCQLARARVPDEVIYSIITDSSLGISASVLDKGSSAKIHKYAVKQITDAKIDTEDFERGGKEGKTVLGTPANIELAIRRLGVRLNYDEFADRMLIEGLEGFGPVLRDAAVNRMRIRIAEQFQLKTDKTFFFDVVEDIARREKFHPVRDYLDGLEWDKTERLDNWLSTYAGAEDNAFTRAVGALWLIAAVRRVRQPGCKFDEMLVFESATGLNKSSALRVLAVNSDWFTDGLPLGRPSKEVIEQLSGKWIVECAELEGLTQDKVENIKGFLSRQADRARAAYARLTDEVLRQWVAAGSTNQGQYLFDTTGNRRFWPVAIKKFDLEPLKRDVHQLWAEAAAREAHGVSIRLPEELWPLAAQEQAARLAVHPWQEKLDGLLGDRQGVIRGADVWRLLDIPIGNLQQKHGAQVGGIMRALGFTRKQKRFGGNPVGVFVRGDNEEIAIHVRYGDTGRVELHVERPRAVGEEKFDGPF